MLRTVGVVASVLDSQAGEIMAREKLKLDI